MDPITQAIIAGVSSGIATGTATVVTDKGINQITQLYNQLKDKLRGKYSSVIDVAEKLEMQPESKGYRIVLQETMEETNAIQDQELVSLANQFLALQSKSNSKLSVEQNVDISGDSNTVIQAGGDLSYDD